MRNYHQDYFYMFATGDNTPMLSFDKNQVYDTHLLFRECPVDGDYVVTMKFGQPIPRNPELGDVLEKSHHLVVSDRLKAMFKGMKLKGVQYLPTEIRDPRSDEIHTNYWVLHVHNLIHCMNHEESKYDTSNDSVASIQRLVFDHEALYRVPLAERLVFALGEQSLYVFFHRSVVEQIVALHPVNVSFTCLGTKEEINDPLPETILPYVIFSVRKEEKKKEKIDHEERLRRKLVAHGIIKDTVPPKPEDEDIPEI